MVDAMTNPPLRNARTSLTRRSFVIGQAAAALAAAWPSGGLRAQDAGPRLQAGRLDLRIADADNQSVSLDAFSGSVPGPILRVRRGGEIKPIFINDLKNPFAVQWRGVRGAQATAPILPGTQLSTTLKPQDAGTFWYCVSPRGAAAPARGLYGFLVVDEAEPVDVDGELLLALDEWTLPSGRRLLRVNGGPSADRPVRAGERLRLRLLNATPDRIMVLRIDVAPVWVMALDSQPAEPFAARDGRIALAPGSRADLCLDIQEAGSTTSLALDEPGGAATIVRLFSRPDPTVRRRTGPPAPLPPNALPSRIDFRNAVRPEIQLARPSDEPAPAFSVRRGRPVVLALANSSPAPQVVHVHGHAMRLLDRMDDGWKPFWLDTVLVAPGQTERVAFVAEAAGRWPIEVTPLGEPTTVRVFEVTPR